LWFVSALNPGSAIRGYFGRRGRKSLASLVELKKPRGEKESSGGDSSSTPQFPEQKLRNSG
jgi:hypothetical protein